MLNSIPAALGRIARALILDTAVFREVRDDPRAIWTGTTLVVIAGAARGIGDWRLGGAEGVLVSAVLALLVWLLACGVVAGVGRLFARPQLSVVLRTCAFASAPATLLAFTGFPLPVGVRTLVWVVSHFAIIIAFVFAVREALRVGTRNALYACVATLGVGLLVLLWAETVMRGRPPL